MVSADEDSKIDSLVEKAFANCRERAKQRAMDQAEKEASKPQENPTYNGVKPGFLNNKTDKPRFNELGCELINVSGSP